MIKNTISFILLSILLSCTDHENLYDRDYPLIKTLPSENISGYGATFSATLVGDGQFSSEEFGFIWNKNGNQSKTGSEWKSLGSTEQLSDFSLEIFRTLEENETYYVMAYAVYDKRIIYGNVERFMTTPAPKPQLKKLIPNAGTWGDTISIVGKDFSYIKEKNTVLFGTITSKVLAINDTTIKVLVPTTLKESISPVTVVVSTQKSAPLDFTFKKPALLSSSKMEIALCDTIEIRGENLPSDVSTIYFGDQQAKVIKASPISYKVAVPYLNSSITSVLVSMNYNNEKFTLSAPLTFKSTKLLSVLPTSASFLDTLKINLVNIPTCAIQAQFATLKVEPIEKTSSYVKVIVPTNYYASPMQVQLVQGSNVILSTSIPRNLKITSVIPAIADVNDIITLHGQGFHPAGENVINIFGTNVIPVSSTKNEIKFKLPNVAVAINGIIPITLTVAGQTVTSQLSIYPAKVTSITPTGPITLGTIITVTGEHFNTNPAYNVLRNLYTNKLFSPVSATPTTLTYIADHNSLSVVKYQAIKYTTNFEFQSSGFSIQSPFTVDYKGLWTDLSDFPGVPRTGAINISLGSRLYFGLGKSSSGVTLKDFWMYNVTDNTWTQLPDFPGDARANAMSWSLNGIGYLGCGTNASNTKLKDVWSFNGSTQSWNQLSDFPGADLPKAYIFFGQAYASSQLEFWQFNSVNQDWIRKNNLTYPILHAGSTGSSFYAVSLTGSQQFSTQNLFYYLVGSDQWSTSGMPVAYGGTWISGLDKLYLLSQQSSSAVLVQLREPISWITTPYAGPTGTGTIYGFSSGTKLYILIGTKISELQLVTPP